MIVTTKKVETAHFLELSDNELGFLRYLAERHEQSVIINSGRNKASPASRAIHAFLEQTLEADWTNKNDSTFGTK